jgi:hypothetical protein
MFFVVGDIENGNLSALMVLVFSPKKWFVSYKICVTTVDKNNKTFMENVFNLTFQWSTKDQS